MLCRTCANADATNYTKQGEGAHAAQLPVCRHLAYTQFRGRVDNQRLRYGKYEFKGWRLSYLFHSLDDLTGDAFDTIALLPQLLQRHVLWHH